MSQDQIDIAELLIRKAGSHLGDAYNISILDPTIQGEQEHVLRKAEAESCIQAILLFQAGMEAIINEEIESNRYLHKIRKERQYYQKKLKDLSFKNKWERAFTELGVNEEGFSRFQHYMEFYRKFRVTITHPKNRYIDVSQYRFKPIYEGLKNGWETFMTLSQNIDLEYTTETWEDFCESCGIPALMVQE